MPKFNIVTERRLLFSVLFLFIIAFILLIISIYDNEHKQITAIEDSFIEKSRSHYNHIKEIQLWYTDNFALYIKDKFQPPFQNDSQDNEFIKLSHSKITKQYARYAKQFDSFYFKLTSLNPLSLKNAPDPFEEKGLLYLEKNPNKDYYYSDPAEAIEKGSFDFIGSLNVNNQCLKCHGVQGYKENDLKGGIRITVDTTLAQEEIETIQDKFFKFKILAILAGVFILFFNYWVIKYIFKQHKELEHINNNLEHIVEDRTKELNELNESLEGRIEKAVEKNKAQEELMIAQSRHAAMGEMISMIAHQWRQPIAAISMGANNIILDIELDEMNKDDFNTMAHDILGQTKYLTKTIDDFSNFFKPIKEKNTIYPKDVIEESLSIIGKSLENNGIALEKKFEETSQIETYSRELLQVLINIIKNSKEAFETSTDIQKVIVIELKETKDTIVITISDNAGGIPEDIIEKIFDPYFSTKKERNGTGLGLYMSKTIVSKHLYGNLNVKNNESGAVFNIELPKDNK